MVVAAGPAPGGATSARTPPTSPTPPTPEPVALEPAALEPAPRAQEWAPPDARSSFALPAGATDAAEHFARVIEAWCARARGGARAAPLVVALGGQVAEPTIAAWAAALRAAGFSAEQNGRLFHVAA